MKLKESQKEFIDQLSSNLPKDMVSIEDIQEHILDECMDQEDLFDLSDDEDGDLYQEYFNVIYQYISDKMGSPFWVMGSVVYSLDNVQQISFTKDRIVLKYQDGTTNTLLVNEGVEFVRGYVSEMDSPLIDHCIWYEG